jgi:hypothetical protein
MDGDCRPSNCTTKWRHVEARHGSASRSEVEQTESASADGTSFVTASFGSAFLKPVRLFSPRCAVLVTIGLPLIG